MEEALENVIIRRDPNGINNDLIRRIIIGDIFHMPGVQTVQVEEFQLNNIEDKFIKPYFRFLRQDIPRLARALRIPNNIRTQSGHYVSTDIICLRNVTLHLIPSIVEHGHRSTLYCTYDLEDDTLYSVKWYRGNNEFYRYAPGDTPAVKYFSIQGISVDLSKSNSAQVVLKDIEFNLAGNFSCEVTTDSPNIHTRIDSKSMLVVQLPEHPPEISVGREPLDYGDILRANCSSYPSRPPADLKFILNNITVNQSEPTALRRQSVRDWTDLQLELKLSFMHFNEGRLFLECVAQVSTIYRRVARLELESVRHPVPARVSAPSSTGTRFSAEIKHTIQLSAYLVLLAFVVSQTCY